MIDDKLFLTPEEILNKEFKIDARGYRMQEVDKFLDMVIRDYAEYISIIKKLEKDIKDLTDDNIKLKQEIRKLNEELTARKEANNDSKSNITNLDLLKRISQLEKVVFGKEE